MEFLQGAWLSQPWLHPEGGPKGCLDNCPVVWLFSQFEYYAFIILDILRAIPFSNKYIYVTWKATEPSCRLWNLLAYELALSLDKLCK